MGSLALKDLTEKHSTNMQRLPLTKDLILFNKYCYEIAEQAKNDLQSDKSNLAAFKRLSEAVLVLTISINRKRVGDVQYTKVDTYNKDFEYNDCLDILTESEKEMTKFFKRIVTIGKGSRAVPLLFPKKIQYYIDILLQVRKETTIVPKENPYLFALAGSQSKWIDGPSTLRKYAQSCGAENPETLTSSRLRKQIATVLQILNLSEVEMEQIAKFMGHTKKTHEEFYRLPQELFQTSKVAKLLLMTMEKGISTEEQGKTIDEIDFELVNWREDEKVPTNRHESSPEPSHDSREEIPENSNESKVIFHSNIVVRESKNDERKSVRGAWNKTQKDIMLQYFKKHIKNKIPPRKGECLEFREKNLDKFESKNWVQIKTFVYNTYRLT
ncbi:uncharacterized protein LOC123321865 [Coccinella septempunctata]|uniref:uncharacterized protein LOC123321865 n=1 Tax=Coccinella septempunctata TaxID=41139 RepID=UPI001D063730|nr:uncharacterized protein LOC123321865 [Coccinella septempunctata]